MKQLNVALAVLSVLSIVTGNVFGVQYTVTDLGANVGIYTSSVAYDINDSGQIVGYSASADYRYQRAFLYSGSTMTDLGRLDGGTVAMAKGINNSGQVVGMSSTAGSANGHAFLYSGSTMVDLGTNGGVQSVANAINNRGHLVGSFQESDGCYYGFLYDGSQTFELPVLGGIYTRGTAKGINDSGQIIGYSYPASGGGGHAFLYSDSTITDLGTLGGTMSQANGINNSGQVVGMSYLAGAQGYHAFLYSGSTMTDLGTVGGIYTFASQAMDINDSGQIVGRCHADNSPSNTHAFIYSNGTMTDLNTLIEPNSGWTLSDATAINNSGWIVGYGIDPTGHRGAFLLTPVPEPSTFVFIGVAAVSLAVHTHRRGSRISRCG